MAPQPSTDESNDDRFFCGCTKCQRKGEVWRGWTTWYRHKAQREEDISAGCIPPPDPSLRVPARRQQCTARTQDEDAGDEGEQAPRPRAEVQPVDREIPGVEQAGGRAGNVGEGAGTGSDLGVDAANLSFGSASQHVPTVAESRQSEQDMSPSGLGGRDPGPAHTTNAPTANGQSNNDQLAEDFAPDTPPLRQSSHVPILNMTLKFINILQSDPSASDKKLDDETQS
ncbi:hypothetical protein C8Q72DRAFT_835694 [Fomitopsis betulina]|nr:hypothetical protein C8Q72DRAFT_835694 [Fomitopsis betulina]